MRESVYSYPFDDSVDLRPAAGAFFLGGGEHDSVLDLVVQARPLRVCEHDFDIRVLGFQVRGYAGEGASCACTRNKRRETPAALGKDLWPGGGVVHGEVVGGLELVCKVAVGGGGGGGEGGVRGGERAREVDKVCGRDDGRGGCRGEGGAEFEEERGLFEGLVVRHAAAGGF